MTDRADEIARDLAGEHSVEVIAAALRSYAEERLDAWIASTRVTLEGFSADEIRELKETT